MFQFTVAMGARRKLRRFYEVQKVWSAEKFVHQIFCSCPRDILLTFQLAIGVLNVEIDTMEPKVTILGNVEPKTLIKKLSKVGKQAEIWSKNNQNATKENKESRVSPSIKIETENFASDLKQMNHSETPPATSTDKHTESVVSKEGAGNKELDHKAVTFYGTSGMVRTGNPLLHQPEASGVLIHPGITTHDGACKVISTDTFTQQYYYMVEPARGPVILPYCAVYPCKATPVYTRSPELYNYAETILEPPVQAPASTTVLGDYFNDENTVGCQIM